MFDLLFESLYPAGHPLRRPVGGTHDSLTAAKLEHAQAFVKEHYRPDNCTITIVGDVDHRGGEAAAGHLAGRGAVRAGRAEGPAVEPRKRVGERQAPAGAAAGEHQAGPAQGADRQTRCCCWPGRCRPGCGAKTPWPQFAASRLNLALGEPGHAGGGRHHGRRRGVRMPLADSSVMVHAAPTCGRGPIPRRPASACWTCWFTPGRSELRQAADRGQPLVLGGQPAAAGGRAAAHGGGVAEYMAATGKPSYFKEQLRRSWRTSSPATSATSPTSG